MWTLVEQYLARLGKNGILEEAFGPELLSKYGFPKDSFTEPVFAQIQQAAKAFPASKQGQVIRQTGRLILQQPTRTEEALQVVARLGAIPNADINVLVKAANLNELHHAVDALQARSTKQTTQSGFNIETSPADWTDGRYKVYKAHSEDACIRYGKGYTFCISRRAGGNMYHTYRRDQLAFYFVFDTKENPQAETYITVVGVKPGGKCEFTHKSNDTHGTTKHYGGSLDNFLASKPGLAAAKAVFAPMPHTQEEKDGYDFYAKVEAGTIPWNTLTPQQKMAYVNHGENLVDDQYADSPAEVRIAFINRGNLISNYKAKVSSEAERRRAATMFFRHGATHYSMRADFWAWPYATAELLQHFVSQNGYIPADAIPRMRPEAQAIAIPGLDRLTAEQYATLTIPQRLHFLKKDPLIKEDILRQMGPEERSQVLHFGSRFSDDWEFTPEEDQLLGRRLFGHIFNDPAVNRDFYTLSNHDLSGPLRAKSGQWMEAALAYYTEAKKAGTLQEGYREGEESTFTHDGQEYSLDQVLAQVENEPITTFQTDELTWVLPYTDIEPERVEKADTKAPVLVAISDEGQPTVVDGAHRLSKAEKEGQETVPSHLVSDTVLAKAAITEEEFNALSFEGRREALAGVLAEDGLQVLPDFKVPYLDREQLLRFVQNGGTFTDEQFQRSHIQVRLLYARQLASLGRSLTPAQYATLSDTERDLYLDVRTQSHGRVPLHESVDRWARLAGI